MKNVRHRDVEVRRRVCDGFGRTVGGRGTCQLGGAAALVRAHTYGRLVLGRFRWGRAPLRRSLRARAICLPVADTPRMLRERDLSFQPSATLGSWQSRDLGRICRGALLGLTLLCTLSSSQGQSDWTNLEWSISPTQVAPAGGATVRPPRRPLILSPLFQSFFLRRRLVLSGYNLRTPTPIYRITEPLD